LLKLLAKDLSRALKRAEILEPFQLCVKYRSSLDGTVCCASNVGVEQRMKRVESQM
jgi:hypothetical protein